MRLVSNRSANNAVNFLTSPFLLTLPVRLATLVSVPAVSKKSTNKNANAVPIKPAVAIMLKSKLNACSGLGIAPASPFNCEMPVAQAIADTASIPRIIAPGTLRLSKLPD